MLPQARHEKLTVRELAEDTLVYDTERHKAHSLNPTAAWIWRHCDGKTSPEELARLLHAEFQLPQAEEVVRLALEQLGRRHLLAEALPPLSEMARISRRDALKKLVVAGLVLPIVTTVVTRNTAQAFSYVQSKQPCPKGITACGSPTIFGQLCCAANETCSGGFCIQKPATPCLPVGSPCIAGTLTCCGPAGGGNVVCPVGGTC
jgi:hypothetical protein